VTLIKIYSIQTKGGFAMGIRCLWSALAIVSFLFLGCFAIPGAQATVTLEVMNPRGEIPTLPVTGIMPRINELAGKKIALVDNGKAGADYFLDAIEETLKKQVPTATIVRFKKPRGTIIGTPELYPKVAQACDAFIYATGD
jgi:hypothetical protein